MLEDLSVKDFALIDSVSLDFTDGLNVLSGETGAGKSILIGSLTFLLGAKAGPDSIRTGAEEARVSGTMLIPKSHRDANDWLAERGILPDNERVLIRRVLKNNGKSATWIQDTQVTRNDLADFTAFIVDIHGQHEHQSLLKTDEHRRFLDSYAGILEDVRDFTDLYTSLAGKKRLRDELNTSESERARKIELLQFAVEEITAAKLVADEENELAAEEQRMGQFEKLYSLADQITASFSGHEGAVGLLKKARVLFDTASSIDPDLENDGKRLDNCFYELEDISQSIAQYKDSLTYDPSRLEFIQNRLSSIYKLKQKYGMSIQAVMDYRVSAERDIETLLKQDQDRSALDREISDLEKKLYTKGIFLSEKRKSACEKMQTEVEAILRDLGMPGTSFRVGLTSREGTDTSQRSGPYGFETVEFVISPNPGEPLRPLVKIASGGELSRVMLALKTVLADSDSTSTLIFDEIDTGIGGEVALAVGSHLKQLSKRKQVLCITHLASIAVRADNHVKIEKRTDGGKTITGAYPIQNGDRVKEIARMLAGDGFSSASMKHAQDLLNRYAQ